MPQLPTKRQRRVPRPAASTPALLTHIGCAYAAVCAAHAGTPLLLAPKPAQRVSGQRYLRRGGEEAVWLGGRWGCQHGRQKSHCTDCGGAGICEHNRRRGTCKDCGGAEVCEHGRQRRTCKDCGGGGICEHGRRRGRCRRCKGLGEWTPPVGLTTRLDAILTAPGRVPWDPAYDTTALGFKKLHVTCTKWAQAHEFTVHVSRFLRIARGSDMFKGLLCNEILALAAWRKARRAGRAVGAKPTFD